MYVLSVYWQKPPWYRGDSPLANAMNRICIHACDRIYHGKFVNIVHTFERNSPYFIACGQALSARSWNNFALIHTVMGSSCQMGWMRASSLPPWQERLHTLIMLMRPTSVRIYVCTSYHMRHTYIHTYIHQFIRLSLNWVELALFLPRMLTSTFIMTHRTRD